MNKKILYIIVIVISLVCIGFIGKTVSKIEKTNKKVKKEEETIAKSQMINSETSIDEEYQELVFKKIISNNDNRIDGITGGITNIEMGISGDVLFFVDPFDNNKLKTFNFKSEEINVLDVDNHNQGTIYFSSTLCYYFNGISIYELHNDGSIKLVVDNFNKKKILDISNNKICYYEENYIFVAQLNNLEKLFAIEFNGYLSDVKLANDVLFAVSGTDIIKIDLFTGEITTICKYEGVATIYWDYHENIYIYDMGIVNVYNTNNDKLTKNYFQETNISLFTNTDNGYCYLENNEYNKDKIVEATTKKTTYLVRIEEKNEHQYSITDIVSNSKYFAIYSPANDTGLYFAEK